MAIEDIDTKGALIAFVRRELFGGKRRVFAVRPVSYLTADIPGAADHEGEIIYVPDGAAGAKFQGSNGTAWVNLG